MPSQGGVAVIFNTSKAVSKGGMPSALSTFDFKGAYLQLTSFVGGKRDVLAVG